MTSARAPPQARVVEWYAGVGVLGLSLAPDAEWVRCSDVHPPHAAFAASRLLLPPEHRDKVTYAVGAAGSRVDDANGADTALVDPPRKGLDATLLDALCEDPQASLTHGGDAGDVRASANPCAGLATLIYVSCGFPALARDADALLASGWRVRDSTATAHILFPGADHIETVVVFEREPSSSRGHPPAATGDADEPKGTQRPRAEGGADSSSSRPKAKTSPAERKGRRTERGERGERPTRDANTPRARRLAANKRRAERARELDNK